MKPFALRWRIIGALLGLSLSTTLALAFMGRYFLDLSLQSGVNLEMGHALTSALSMAKENYDTRKHLLTEVGEKIYLSPLLAKAYRANQPDRLSGFFQEQGLKNVTLTFTASDAPPGGIPINPSVFKVSENTLRLTVPIQEDGRVEAFLRADQD
jgi:hypothetical protein